MAYVELGKRTPLQILIESTVTNGLGVDFHLGYKPVVVARRLELGVTPEDESLEQLELGSMIERVSRDALVDSAEFDLASIVKVNILAEMLLRHGYTFDGVTVDKRLSDDVAAALSVVVNYTRAGIDLSDFSTPEEVNLLNKRFALRWNPSPVSIAPQVS